jgi:putative endonuclease
MKEKKEWLVYMIEAENGFLYTGITKDLERRFQEHLTSPKSAKFFRSSPPKKMVYSKKGFSYSGALIEEHRIKKLTREQKDAFIRAKVEKKTKRKS